MEDNYKLDIRPKASVYAYFTNLDYSEEYALAEFIDNSTASYYDHKDELMVSARSPRLTIIINYDSELDTLTITDDAYGMELEDFKNAILLGAKTSSYNSRNEFGYGLKTAATWFGRHWEVRSSRYDSNNCYSACIDIDDIKQYDIEEIDIVKGSESKDKHYTQIIISKMNKPLKTAQVKKRIGEVLQSLYRRDIASGCVDIIFNGTTLSPLDLDYLKDFEGRDWHKELDFGFVYENKTYNVTGFVEISWPGSFRNTGFSLFRRNRVVVDHYKPKEIFGQQQSQISLKLRGEVDLDDFPIAQAKNQIGWNQELKELFILKLKENITDFLRVANMSKAQILAIKETPPKVEDEPKESSNNEPKVSNGPINIIKTVPDKPVINVSNDAKPIYNHYYLKYHGNIYNFEIKPNSCNGHLYTYDKNTKSFTVDLMHNSIKDKINAQLTTCLMILSYEIAKVETVNFQNEDGSIALAFIENKFNGILLEIEVVSNA